MSGLPAALRPHVKIHKSPILGRMQVEAGAIGLTTATLWEASAMVAAGLDGLLIANQAVGPRKAAELARIAGLADVTIAVESAHNAEELARRRRPRARGSGSSSSTTSASTAAGPARMRRRSSWRASSSAIRGCACAACSATRGTACSSPIASCASRRRGPQTPR